VATFILVDGHSLTHRAFNALPTDLMTASGQVTNAVFGFTSMLINVIRDHKPDGIVVAFDRPEKTFRHEMIDTYKGTRSETHELLRPQFGLVRQVLDAMHIPIVELPGYEADDVLATLATAARDNGDLAILVTGDRDSYQLVEDPYVKVLYNKRGVSDYAFYDEAGIAERTGVTPALYAQYAALRGDTSDNLPGVPGVGEKTAAKLINQYGGLDGIFANAEAQTPKLRQNLVEFEDRARLNLEAMTLVRDAPIDFDVTTVRWTDVDVDEIQQLFEFLEFRSLYDRLNDVLDGRLPTAAAGAVLEAEVLRLETASDVVTRLGHLRDMGTPIAIAGAWTSSGLDSIAMVESPDDGGCIAFAASLLADDSVAAAMNALVGVGGSAINAHHIKPIMVALHQHGIDLRSLDVDTKLAAYLIDPADANYDLSALLLRYCQMEMAGDDSGSDGQLSFGDEPSDIAVVAAREALAVDRLAPLLDEVMRNRGMRQLYDDIERPLVRVLAQMEELGVGVDVGELHRLHDYLVGECDRLEASIIAEAGHDFNVNSTKQLREVLFDELGLTPQKKTKTGFSTDAASLEKIVDQHQIVQHLLDYREVEKLRSTYGQGLLDVVGPDERIHATFNQTVARTGRLSSEDPNLHNIPVRSEQGREFRRAFVPAPGWKLLVADYNQIELRVIAHLAQDPGLIDAFESGRDIHSTTAASVFGVEPDAVTVDQRSKAKMVSYGLAYGMEAYGLAQRLGIDRSEAAAILDAYFVAFPNVRSFMDRVVADAKDKGYTETEFGRRRLIPELNSPNRQIRAAAERQAMNAPIQGLAADIFKVALVRLDQALADAGTEARVVLQVHDEVILEVPPDEVDAIRELTVSVMRDAATLRVRLEVNVSVGNTWADAKG
jgi:DNA polymerase I